MIYSSIVSIIIFSNYRANPGKMQTPTVYMTSTAPDGNVAQIPISFADPVRRPFFSYGETFGIWSCRFSADGNEVVAGGSGKIFGLLKFSDVFQVS